MKMNSIFFVLAFSCVSLQVVGNDSRPNLVLKELAHKFAEKIEATGAYATEQMVALKSFAQNLSQESLIEMVKQDKDLVGRMHEQWGKN